jgi:hypothetical protein
MKNMWGWVHINITTHFRNMAGVFSVITLSLLVIGLALNYNQNHRTRTIQAG